MKKIVLALVLCIITLCLWAQFDERAILTQQAQQLMARRQYADAELVFKQILTKFPNDVNSVSQLIQIYIATSQIDKAETLLEANRRILSPSQYSEQRILLFVMQGKPLQAWEISMSYLAQNNHEEHRYLVLARYFESRGFFEQALNLYQMGRKHHKNDNLFALEYANLAISSRQFELALNEYLRFLERQPNNLFFVNNQCKTILQEDSTLIRVIGDFAQKSSIPEIQELYATCLVMQKQFASALSIYLKLPPEKILRFAEDQYTSLNDDVAYDAYEYLSGSYGDDVQKADFKYRMAQIRIRNARYSEAHQILTSIIEDQQLLDRRIRNRTAVNLNSRKMMAELILSTTTKIDSALVWYENAKSFARNGLESAEIELEISKLLIMNESYDSATDKLNALTEPKLLQTKAYYQLLIALMQRNVSLADSLMNEYVIKYPGSSYTNDSIYLMMLVYAMEEEDQALFMQAYRKKQLYQKEAINLLLQIFEHNQDEELRILAVEWALQLADKTEALKILDYPWTDEIAIEYAALIKLKLINDSEYEQRYAREFLKQNPNSVFSPNFRQVISRISSGKPNL